MGQRVRLSAEAFATATRDGGRRSPITSGYRPLCVLDDANTKVTIGLCELEAATAIHPGTHGRATLVFDERVAADVARLAREGTAFEISEGTRVVATGRVLAIS